MRMIFSCVLLTILVLPKASLNPLTNKGDWHLISPYYITSESKVYNVIEMIAA